MFVRKKKNSSGSISVQILRKKKGRNLLVETMGCSNDEHEIEKLEYKAKNRIEELQPQKRLDLLTSKEEEVVFDYLQKSQAPRVRMVGPERTLGKIFDKIGFGGIDEELFRHIVLSRLTYPVSKLKTLEYLLYSQEVSYEISQVYRFLDRFHKKHKEDVKRIAYEHTKKILKNITIVFYDMTTLYFEAEDEDDLRKIGFSKDGKFQKPQIMLGLLVGENGYPIGYDIFGGNTFEGHTLIPIIEQVQKKYGFPKPIVIADSGLLSKKNLENLSQQKYDFILGARIRNESDKIKEEILQKTEGLENGESVTLSKSDGTKLIVSYSDKRKKKDEYNREKGLRRLKERVKSGKLTKEQINNRGYNKFLTLENEVNVCLDETKVAHDSKWDGLKGYATNADLSSEEVINNYKHLWQIEKAFRISKTDLRIRPIFHRKKDRIEAHICIAFVAYSIYKELERLLKENKLDFSPAKAIWLSKTIYELEFTLPESHKTHAVLANISSDQEALLKIFEIG
jgi:transposase